MGSALKYFVLGLVLMAVGIGLLRFNFYVGLAMVGIGVLILGWFQGEFLRQLILWIQLKGTKNQQKNHPPTHTTQVTAEASPYVINNPTIGFLNLAGDEGKRLAQHDYGDLSSEFTAASDIESDKIPRCNVLFLYCTLDASGKTSEQQYLLRDLIRAAGAQIAVIASEIPHGVVTSSEFNCFLQSKDEWPANIIITLNRNGEAFGHFFKNLFSQMRAGMTMPHAWVKLVPQGLVTNAADNPGTVALFEAGHIAFAVV
jgi:hypothetical protein